MNAQPSIPKIRLNPFLFPSETDLRFVLLIVILLAESLFTYSYINSAFFAEQQINRTMECNEISGHFESLQQFDLQMFSPFSSAAGSTWADQTNEASRMFEECMRVWDLSRAFWGLGGCGLFALVTFGIYWLTPIQKIKRGNYELISTEDAGVILDELKSICTEIDMTRPPIFLWDPLNSAISGLAFGHFGKYYIVITGGLVTQYYTDQQAFRSVVHHELAHLYNRDVDRTYLTVAAWQAFIFVVLVPQFYMVFIHPLRRLFMGLDDINSIFNSLLYAIMFAVDAAVLFVLVYLTTNALLRTRELYADVRASVWDGSHGSLGQVLQTLISSPSKLPDLLRSHPNPQKRIDLLTNTSSLFGIGLLEVFMIGVAAMVGTDEFRTLLLLLMPFFSQQEITAGLITGLLYSIILVGILGTLVWRSVFFHAMTGRRISRSIWWRIGITLGIGSALGASISFANVTSMLYTPANIILVFLFNLFLGFFLGLAFSLFLIWMAENTSIWLAFASTPIQLHKLYVCLSVLSVITMTCWLGWALTAWSPGNAALTLVGLLGGLPLAATSPYSIVFFALLWISPLAIYAWSRKISLVEQSWAFLEAPIQMNKLTIHQLSIKKVLLVSISVGLFYIIADVCITFFLRLVVPAATRESDTYKITAFIVYIALAILAQVLIAIIVAIWARELKFTHGLLAAFIGGCIMSVGFSVDNLLFGGGWIPVVFPWMLNGGAMLVLPILLLITVTQPQGKH